MSIAKPQTTSLIDTLNQGFAAVNRRLWVLVIPVLLNIAIWYGVQVSFQPLVNNIITLLQQTTPAIEGVPATTLYEGWRELGQYDLAYRFDQLNLVPKLTTYAVSPADGLPVPREILPLLEPDRVRFSIGNGSIAMLLFLAVNALLIPVGAAFLTLLAGAVRGDRDNIGIWLRRFSHAFLSILGYAAVLLAALVVIGLPFVVIGGLLSLVSPALATFIALLLFTGIFWLNIYIGFAPEAITVGELDPIHAIRSSFNLVRRHFWATVVLLLVSFMITVGLGVIWQPLVQNEIGRVAAILGSAYIGTGLMAARMIFYRERVGTR